METKTKHYQYTIKDYATSTLIKEICKQLEINKQTYYRKVNVKIGENGGFTVSQMMVVSSILNRPLNDLISNDAVKFYLK